MARQRGWRTSGLVVELARRVVRAVADEFDQRHLLLRFTAEDLVYDRARRAYVVHPEVTRHPLDGPPARMSLVDNGLYAPEITGQIRRELSARTDVYTVGALLFHLISGLEPVSDLSRLGDKLPSLRVFEPDLPLGVDPLVRRALSRAPESRHDDPGALHRDLLEALELHARRSAAGADRPLEVTIGVSTNAGIRKSEKNPVNQDQFFSAWDPALSLGLAVVADGVSTCDYGSGEKAAECVVAAARELWQQSLADPANQAPPSWRDDERFRRQLGAMLDRANEAIGRLLTAAHPAPFDPGARLMSSTAVAVVLNGARAIVANLGDSRLYVVHGDRIDQVTVDMNRRTSLLRRDRELEAVVNTSDPGHLTGIVGRFTNVGGALVPAPLAPELQVFDLLPGDRLLLCSDGVPDCIGADAPSKIRQILKDNPRPSRAAWELVVAANENGGDDNVTAVVVDCVGKEEEAQWPTS